jgi:hypothetical protein
MGACCDYHGTILTLRAAQEFSRLETLGHTHELLMRVRSVEETPPAISVWPYSDRSHTQKRKYSNCRTF